uniref:retinol-binding protein 1 n=1 Tax=Callithrix jacchus TaxID=9483 RepID=UPI0023DD6307|nr:retinol-binding protein 1 [Callithrix jacchus]
MEYSAAISKSTGTKEFVQQSNPRVSLLSSSFVGKRTERLKRRWRGRDKPDPSTAPAPALALARRGGATATMDPPAGFVRARNPAVAAPQSPLSPEGAHFRAAHHPPLPAAPGAPRGAAPGLSPEPSGAAALLPPPQRAAVRCFWTPEKASSATRAASRLRIGKFGIVRITGGKCLLVGPGHVNVALRKIANLLKPDKEIVQDGDHMIIRTLSTFRNYIMDFQVGKEFEEDLTGIDDRKCMTTVSWDGDKLQCVQKGEKEGRGWTQWIEGDELHLEMRVEGVVCKQVFKKVQ